MPPSFIQKGRTVEGLVILIFWGIASVVAGAMMVGA